jgi:hypothetical protein
LLIAVVLTANPTIAFETIGDGYGSKWGDDPNAGTGAIVTWGYMLDSTELDPEGFPFHEAITGTSNMTQLRGDVDAAYGTGSFDAAIQRAFDTWSAVANITFVGPVTDSGLAVGAVGATSPHIRIGAFEAVPGEWFEFGSSIGLGPPGPWGPDYFPLSGDVIFNVDGLGIQTPYQIAPGTEDVTPVNVWDYGDDVEGLFLHELGHAAMGLDHPSWDGEDPDRRLMYVGDFENPEAPYCCQAINRELHPDDIAAAQFVYGIRGDFNGDGRASAADYTVWRDSLGATVTKGTAADGNINGSIDQDDFDVWIANYGNVAIAYGNGSGSIASAAVPEPTSLLLIIPSLCALLASRCRR